MPCRYIREEFLTSERVDLLDAASERFYFRLFLVVDDFGRYEANEKLLKSKVFPLKDDIRASDITRWLAACEKAGLIVCYSSSEKRYLSINRFSQTRANCRSAKSKYPEPPTVANNLQANVNNLQAFDAENENENENENESEYNAPERAQAPRLTYPQSVDDVMKIAVIKHLQMSSDQANRYLLYRQRSNWMIHGRNKSYPLPAERIPQDLEMWANEDRIRAVKESSSNRTAAAQNRREIVNASKGGW